MKRMLIAAAIVALPTIIQTQTRPNFSGTWMMDQQRSEAAVQDPPSGTVTMIIKQVDTDLTVQINREREEKPLVITSTIAASEQSSPQVVSAPAARSYWNGDSLVTELARNIQGQTVRTKEIRSLDASGKEMTVVTTVIVEHGYTLHGAKNYGIGKDVYIKVAP
jgi:hypothetical protein